MVVPSESHHNSAPSNQWLCVINGKWDEHLHNGDDTCKKHGQQHGHRREKILKKWSLGQEFGMAKGKEMVDKVECPNLTHHEENALNVQSMDEVKVDHSKISS